MSGIVRTRGLVFNARDELLLVRTNHNGIWCAPGGTAEDNETAEQAVIREVHEETGLDVTVGRLVLIHDLLETSSGDHRINFWFACRATQDLPENWEDPDGKVDTARFFSQTSLQKFPDKELFPLWQRDELWQWRTDGYTNHQLYQPEVHDIFPFHR